ncbi:MAG: glycosyltransferase [Oscillatoria sp. PMC 1068.18]|nr:glycosyltransferase [Oscillatoria sp. PMC 1076.18]MEC4988873.1 glycosyltransferase [Oscillatoria sp. PMC 1068.18]
MSLSKIYQLQAKHRILKKILRLRLTTVVMLGILGIVSAIFLSWYLGTSTISSIFSQLHFWQQNPPFWIEVPDFTHQFYLFLPTLILFFIAQVVIKISPHQRRWSQVIVVAILLALTIRYLLWRSLTTLNLATPLDGIFSLTLFCLEFLIIFASSIQLFLSLEAKVRHREADRMQVAVIERKYNPSVDILIPTYNEAKFILRRTIIGCQAIEYSNKKIYLLDDGKREEIRRLAQELGCKYLTRPDNRYAKAGNLNHAISQTTGELIVVFDADFVPTTNFLTRTVGFFQKTQIALVQTHQEFYNFDPIARNLGLENILNHDPEEFSRRNQPIRDGADGVICSGTSFLVRRSQLLEVGGFVTESLSEDYFTGIKLSAKGYRVIYLDEQLSAGLAADSIAEHTAQRLRWGRGTIQAFFIKANPLTIPGLTWRQRLAHLEGLLLWFGNIARICFLILPLAYPFLGVILVRATLESWLYFFLPSYLLQISVHFWLSNRSRSAFISDVYSVALCFPVAVKIVQTLLNPFSTGFRVTAKGVLCDRYRFNWLLALPLIIILLATIVGIWLNFGNCLISCELFPGTSFSEELVNGSILVFVWSCYNIFILSVALLSMLDAPQVNLNQWFNLQRKVELKIGEKFVGGTTTKVSHSGVEVALRKLRFGENDWENFPVNIWFVDEDLRVTGKIMNVDNFAAETRLEIKFTKLDLDKERQLVKMLYCRPGQWLRREAPGELHSLWLMGKSLVTPRIFFRKKAEKIAVEVAQR